MQNETFKSRVSKLMRKSRKALRLYSSPARPQKRDQSKLNELQVAEWREVNAELSKQLSIAMESNSTRRLAAEVFALRDRFYNEWRMAESDLHLKQRDLVSAAENGDFIKTCLMSKQLVVLKARLQACQAAHQELQEVLDRSKISQPTIELTSETIVPDKRSPITQAKVIPLRRHSS